MKTILIYGLIFLVLLNITTASPSYKLGIVPQHYSVNEKEPLTIQLFISGNGNVSLAKLTAYGDKSIDYLSEIEKYNQSEHVELWISNINPKTFLIEKNLKKEFDARGINNIVPLNGEVFGMDEISLRSNQTGDHEILFILTYSENELDWYTDRLEFSFHVNTWWDNNQGWIGFIGVLVALIGLFLPTSRKIELWDFICKFFK